MNRELQKPTRFCGGIPEDGFSSSLKRRSTCSVYDNVDALVVMLFNQKQNKKITCFGVELLCFVKSFDSSPLGFETEGSLTLIETENRI